MREIKFRGKRKDNGEWVYGSYIKFANTHVIGYADKEHGNWNEFDVIPETVGQSTGLKDKNGVEIYEGDKLRVPSHYEGDYWAKEHTMIVEWDDSDSGEGPGFYLGMNITWSECWVIGNIHEEKSCKN